MLGQQLLDYFDRAKALNSNTRMKYQEYGQSLPVDAAQKLSTLEILAESLQGEMAEKERESERARSVRTEYSADVDELQTWLSAVEDKVQDRSRPPHDLRAVLAEVASEVATSSERLERFNRNGRTIVERSKSPAERDVVQSTCSNVTDQICRLRHVVEQKKMAVSDDNDFVRPQTIL